MLLLNCQTASQMRVDLGRVLHRMWDGLPEHVRAAISADGSVIGTLKIAEASFAHNWVTVGSLGCQLKFFCPTGDNVASSWLCYPLLTLSSRRASEALLDLSKTMVDAAGTPKEYVQIVCVKSVEAGWYAANWPQHCFLG